MDGQQGHGRRRRAGPRRVRRFVGLGALAAALSAAAAMLGSGTVTPVAGEDDSAPRTGGASSGGPGDPPRTPASTRSGGPVILGEGRATSPRSPSTGASRSPSAGASRTPSERSRGNRAPTGTELGGVYVTAYTWFDNTPPGSSAVSHPVLHGRAGGTGTYADPVTVAVGHDRSSGRDVLDHPAGTRFYLPHLRRYFMVEDTCGDGPTPQDGPCHDLAQAPPGTTLWLDVWIDGRDGSPADVDACAARLTGSGGRTAVLDPPPGLPVLAGPVFGTRCALP